MAKEAKLKVKNPKKMIITIVVILLIGIIAFNIKNNTIKKKDKLSIIINNQDITSKLENEAIIKENIEYLSLNDTNKFLQSKSYQEEKYTIITTNSKIIAFELESKKIEINGSTIEIKGTPFKNEKDIVYLPISELKSAYDIDFTYSEEYKNIVIDSLTKKKEKARLTKNTMIKEEKSIFSASIENVKRGDWITYISEENGWAKVKTENGNIGYTKRKNLTNFEVEREEIKEQENNAKTIEHEKDITNKNISNYKNRRTLIDEILIEAVEKHKKVIKITYKKDIKTEQYKRLKKEATTVLKECGITLVFE